MFVWSVGVKFRSFISVKTRKKNLPLFQGKKLSRVREYLAKSRKFTPAKKLNFYPYDLFKSKLSRERGSENIPYPNVFLFYLFQRDL